MKILETNYEIKNSSVIQDKLVALQTELTALSTTVTNSNSNLQSLISSVNSSITSILNDLDQKATSIQTLSVNLQSLISSISELVESDAIKTNSVISDYGEIGELHSGQIYTNELETTDLTATNLESTDATITNIYATTLELSNFIISTISAATVSTNSLIAGQGAITEISSTKAILSKVITDKIIGKTLRTPIGTPDNTQLLKISIGEFNGTFTISTEQNEFSITVSENNLVTFIQSNFYIYRIDWNKQNSNLQIYLMNVSDSITYNAISLGSFSNLQIDSELVMRSEIENNISTIGTGLLMRTNPISEAQEKIVQVVVYNSKSEMQEIGIENTIYVVKKDRSYFWNETSQEYVPMSEYTIEYVDELPENPTNKFYGIPHSYNLETTESKTPIDLVGSYFTLHSTGKYVLKDNFTLTYNNNSVGSIYINNFDVSLYANKDFSGLYATTLNSRTVYTWKVTEIVNHTDYYASKNGTFTKIANAQQVEDLFIKNTEKGTAGGVATLGADGKIPIEQMNIKSLKFIGVYDCSSGVFPSTLGRESGDYYRVSVAGTLTELRDDIVIKAGFGLSSFEVNLINSAITSGLEVFTDISEVKTQVLSVSTTSIQCESVDIPLPQSSDIRLYADSEFPFSWEFDVGDFILFNENNEWQKMSNQDSVTSVNGLSGDVVLNGDNINATLDNETKSINSIFSGLFNWIKTKLTDVFITPAQLNNSLSSQNNHNIPRRTPKDITAYYTDGTLWQRLNGTNGFSLFEDIYVGDYIKMSRAITVQGSYDGTVGSQYVTIAGINTLQGNGDNVDMMYNHLVMVAGQGFGGTQHFGRRRMNSDPTTVGGYVGSEMYTTYLGDVATSGNVNGNVNQQLFAEFGSHLKTTRELLSNSLNSSGYNRIGTNSGCSNSWGYYSCQAVLMSEIECYGSTVWSSSGYDTGNANHWLPLFQHSNSARNDRTAYYWLKDVASSSYFCCSSSAGGSSYGGAGDDDTFVRPRFVIA